MTSARGGPELAVLREDPAHVGPGLGEGRDAVAVARNGVLAGVVGRQSEHDVVELHEQVAQVAYAAGDVLLRVAAIAYAVLMGSAEPDRIGWPLVIVGTTLELVFWVLLWSSWNRKRVERR